MFVWVFLGGVAWFAICKLGLKKGTIMGIGITGRGLSFPDAMWAAWSCMVSGSNHTKEVHAPGRIVAITVALGGLLSYSVMTGAISAAIKSRMERLRSTHASKVLEDNHVVIAGTNGHLIPLLKQLSDSHGFALQDGRAKGTQAVLLVNDRKDEDIQALVRGLVATGQLPRLRVMTRKGNLAVPETYRLVSAEKAQKVIMLGNNGNTYEADAQAMSSLLALQSVTGGEPGGRRPEVVIEVSKRSSADLLERVASDSVSCVEDLTNKLLVQCVRQRGLSKVYRNTLQ